MNEPVDSTASGARLSAESDSDSAAIVGKASLDSIKTPGALLRHYREERNVSLADLAAVVKVSVDKLHALERDDYAVLPDMVFTRALASSICRLLGQDAAPVLALFPSVHSPKLVKDTDGLNHTFNAHLPTMAGPGRNGEASGVPKAVFSLVFLLLLIAAGVYFWPQIQAIYAQVGQQASQTDGTAATANSPPGGPTAAVESREPGYSSQTIAVPGLGGTDAQSSGGGASSQAGDAAAGQAADANRAESLAADDADAAAGVEDAGSKPQAELAANQQAPAEEPATVAAETIRIAALEPVWVQIRDGSNAILHQSTLPKGREIAITNTPPLRVEIGRADSVKVTVKGQDFNVQPFARGNVARFEVSP